MSLRDYFAGQALAGILAGGFANTIPHDDINGGSDAAFFAFQYADAMLDARKPRATQEATPMTVPAPRTQRAGFGILNYMGDFWTEIQFDSHDAAALYLRTHWGKHADISEFRIVRTKTQIFYLGEVAQ